MGKCYLVVKGISPLSLHLEYATEVLLLWGIVLLFVVWFSMVRFGMTLSQLNDTNAVQKWSFSKCGFSTCRGSKIKPKHVYGDIVVLFLQKIVWGASCRPPRGPRVTPIL